ncbi:Phosphatidyl-N-methylethanolamine N-methyltransferase, partial [Marasmius tenuissimus]
MFSAVLNSTTSLLKFILSVPANMDWSERSLYVSMAWIVASPLLWNIICRNEYRNKTLSKIMGPRVGCALLGWAITFAGLFRSVLYKKALHDQPRYPLPYEIQTVLAWIIFGTGNTLVYTSYFALGFYGTHLGDYFGILQKERVTRFPFNILENPMYVGSTMCFIGASL